MGTLVTGTAATYVEELTVRTDERRAIICLTHEVERIVRESGIVDGLVLVNPMHITSPRPFTSTTSNMACIKI